MKIYGRMTLKINGWDVKFKCEVSGAWSFDASDYRMFTKPAYFYGESFKTAEEAIEVATEITERVNRTIKHSRRRRLRNLVGLTA